MNNPRTLATTAATVLATLALLSTGTPARAATKDYDHDTRTHYPTISGTTARVSANVNGSHKASNAYVTHGSRGVQARAQCQRRNGGTRWYESTIRVHAGGGSSHYDCDNNGTYNRAIVGLGVDIY
jgi:hypothetical protein